MTVPTAHTHLQPPLKGKRSQPYVDYEYHHPNEHAKIAAQGRLHSSASREHGAAGRKDQKEWIQTFLDETRGDAYVHPVKALDETLVTVLVVQEVVHLAEHDHAPGKNERLTSQNAVALAAAPTLYFKMTIEILDHWLQHNYSTP